MESNLLCGALARIDFFTSSSHVNWSTATHNAEKMSQGIDSLCILWSHTCTQTMERTTWGVCKVMRAKSYLLFLPFQRCDGAGVAYSAPFEHCIFDAFQAYIQSKHEPFNFFNKYSVYLYRINASLARWNESGLKCFMLGNKQRKHPECVAVCALFRSFFPNFIVLRSTTRRSLLIFAISLQRFERRPLFSKNKLF